jgi:hypothetical protein
MRNDSANDRRARLCMIDELNGELVSFKQAAAAVLTLRERKWKWDGKKYHEPMECEWCDTVFYINGENGLCPSCEEKYEKENED